MTRWKSAAARRLKEFANAKSVETAAVEIGRRLTEGQILPPTRLEEIFPRVNIRACYIDHELQTAGELREADDAFEIATSESDSPARRRFTIAHEIAHAVFERTGPHCPRRGRELENLCDMVASQILVPQHSLNTEAKLPLTLAEIERLARAFEVSLTMMAIRCSGQFPVVCSQLQFGEVLWCTSGTSIGIRRPKAKLKELFAKAHEDRRGQVDCQIELNGNFTNGIFEWITTGEERILGLVRVR